MLLSVAAGLAWITAADESQPAPPEIDPPGATVHLSTDHPRVGEPFHLDVRIRWSGSFQDYLLHPPQVQLPEGVRHEGTTAETSSGDGRNLLTYRLALRGEKAGSFVLGPVELRYTPRGEAEPVGRLLEGPTVEVRPWTLAGLTPGGLAATGGALLAGGLALFGLVRWRRGRQPAGESGEARHRHLAERLEEARRQRLEGQPREAFLALAALARELELEGDDEERSRLADGVERARYGGQAPPEAELDRWQRRLGRRLQELAVEPEAAARRALKLRPTPPRENVPEEGTS